MKPLQEKTGHYQAFREVIADSKARSGRSLRYFKTDSDGIFTGEEAQRIYAKHAIRHLKSAPGDSASNDVAERTIRTFAELTRANLLHANAPPSLWAEAMSMVEYVWNRISVLMNEAKPPQRVSRLALLEGHSRQYDLTILRAFGTKCHFLLTLQKKGGKKMAVQAKGRLGVILSIEDNMPAYRVMELDGDRKVRSIPFAQLVSHEGHYPFKNIDLWTSGEKGLPGSFMPSREAQLEPEEWERFAFAPEHCEELGATLDVPLFGLRPPMSTVTEGGTGTTSRVAPEVLMQHPPATPASSHDYEDSPTYGQHHKCQCANIRRGENRVIDS